MKSARTSGGFVLALLSVSYAVSFVDRALVSVAGAPIKADLHLTDSQFGSLQGLAFALLYCLGGLPLGWLADRTDRRAIIAAGLLFWSAMTAACAFAHDYLTFFLARAGVGLGEACLLPAGMSLLSSFVSKGRLGRAVAIFLLGATGGNIVALLAGGQLLAWLSGGLSIGGLRPPWPAWRLMFLLVAPAGPLLAAAMMTIREADAETASRERWALGMAFAHLRRRAPAYAWLTAATACSLTLSQAQAAWLPQLLVRRFALPAGQAAIGVGLMTLASAPLGQWLGGVFIDRVQAAGRRSPQNRLLAMGGLSCLLPAAVFCLADHLSVAAPAYVLFNTLAFATTPAGLSGWQRLTPEASRGVTTAILVAVVTLVGVGLGPLAVGLLNDHVFKSEAALGKSLLCIIVTAGLGCSTFALLGMRSFANSLED